MTITDFFPGHPITSLAVLLGMATAIAPCFAAVTGKGYWQESQSESCPGGAICILDYSAVPVGKQVTIPSVSCAMTVNGPAIIKEVRLGSKNSNGNQQANLTYLTPTKNGVSGTFTYYSINNSSVHILRSGDKANITVTFDSAPTGEIVKCTIGGIILD